MNLSHPLQRVVGFGAEIELWKGGCPFFLLLVLPARFRFRSVRGVDAGLELRQHLLDFQIALYDLLLIDAIQISRLTEGKQMPGPPVASSDFRMVSMCGSRSLGVLRRPVAQPGWRPQWQGQSPR